MIYKQLPQDDQDQETLERRTYSPSSHGRHVTHVRNGWLMLLLFASFLLMMFLSLSPVSRSPAPAIMAASHFVSDTRNNSNNIIINNTIRPVSRKRSCSNPVTKVGFMKTHKTASSTIQNIFMRFGMNKDWNFVLPSHGSHLGPPSNQYQLTVPWRRSWISDVSWKAMTNDQGYNIFALHTKWNQAEVSAVLGSEAKFVTILRNPVDNFESLYNYVHFENHFNHMSVEQFVHEYIEKRMPIQRINNYLGRNQQLWDLGLAKKDITNLEAVKQKIEEIDNDFDLVMIAEDFDASLVLLSDELCWPLVNMTSLKVNARKKSAVEKLSEKARVILKDWLWADQMLYDHFKEKLLQRKEQYGLNNLEREIEKLKQYNDQVKSQCVLETVRNNTKKLSEEYVPWSKDVVAFKIDEETNPYCKFYGISELHFIDYIRDMQVSRYWLWKDDKKG